MTILFACVVSEEVTVTKNTNYSAQKK